MLYLSIIINNKKKVMDYKTQGNILAVVNQLVNEEKFDVLEVLESIPEWNEVVKEASDC